MKYVFTILCLSLIFVACETKEEDSGAQEAFEKNSETVMASLRAWENESIDYSIYADDFLMRGTSYGSSDSISLAEMKTMDKEFLAMYDFRIATDTIRLLPGVAVETNEMDGSVRHYTDWEVTLPATDSTEARSGIIKLYSSADFDEDGKIVFEHSYGDFNGLMMHLHGDDDYDDTHEEDDED